MMPLAWIENLWEIFCMKVRKVKMTWEGLLKIEEKHPFSAGNPTGSFAVPAYKPKKQFSVHKKVHARRRDLVPA